MVAKEQAKRMSCYYRFTMSLTQPQMKQMCDLFKSMNEEQGGVEVMKQLRLQYQI